MALDENMEIDEAVAFAKQMGLASDAIEQRAREYVAAQHSRPPRSSE